MIEDVSDAEQFERYGDQDDGIRGITALNDAKAPAEVDPPCIEELPPEGASVFPNISEQTMTMPLFRKRMPINVDAINKCVALLVALAARTQDRNVVAVGAQRSGLMPHA